MCGIAGAFGPAAAVDTVRAIVDHQRHRGPDAQWVIETGAGALGADRLRIVDLSDEADRPLVGARGTRLSFNGEVYNHAALRREIGSSHPWRTRSDTEVLLAAYERWGIDALHRLIGMFAVVFWEPDRRRAVAARDRFGVKPLYYHHGSDGTLLVASEVGALLAAGVTPRPDAATWASYLVAGHHEPPGSTFWSGIEQVPAGHLLEWDDGRVTVRRWYDLTREVGERDDERPEAAVLAEYRDLLEDSVHLRLGADVPVGVNLSGGIDSASLLALIERTGAERVAATSYTFATGDPRYDETPWVQRLVGRRSPATVVELRPEEVPDLAASVAAVTDEPYGGLATLAYARLFERARADGTVVLLDGQGMDEQWAGYDYYLDVGRGPSAVTTLQGSTDSPVRPDAVLPGLAAAAAAVVPPPATDPIRSVQYRDILVTKLPRALRFNDRVSMRASTELREPFLDHRLVELALRQPAERKVRDRSTKWLLRRLASDLLPAEVAAAPKRPVQTPQREWLRGPLRPWAEAQIELALEAVGGRWLDPARVRAHWRSFAAGEGDNAFFAWQWIGLGLLVGRHPGAFGADG